MGSHDIRGLFVPWLISARDAIWNGRLPLWTSSHFGGFPFLSNPQVALFYPPTWLAIVLPVRVGISWYIVFHIWVAAAGMLLFVGFMQGSRFGARLAAVTFAFSSFFMARIWAGHTVLIATHAWLPWLLLATAWASKRGDLRSAVVAGLPWAMTILAGHISSLLYVGLIWAAFTLYQALVTRHARRVVHQVMIAGLVGTALSGVQLLPLLQLSRLAARATDTTFEFATAYSLPPWQLLTLLIPNLFGEPVQSGYWGTPTFEELTYYVGVLPLLGLPAVLRKPSRLTWFYLVLMLVGLLLALGDYTIFYRPLYTLLPPLRLGRAPARAAFLFVFAASALLGELFPRRQQDHEEQTRFRAWLRGALAVVVIAAAAAIGTLGALFAAQHPAENSGRLWHQIGGVAWMMVIVLVVGGLLWWWTTADSQSRTQRRLLTGALTALVLIDLWSFGARLVQMEPVAPHLLWSDARQIIGEAEARVLPWGISIFEQNGAGQVGLQSIFGYNTLELEATTALVSSRPSPRSKAYDILGVGYVIATVPQDRYTEGERPLALIDHTDNVWVYRRAQTLPLARLLYRAEIIDDTAEAVARIHQPDFDPETAAILHQSPPCQLPGAADTGGSAQIAARRDGYWRIVTNSPAAALLIVAETAYPGWQVQIDGERVEWQVAYTAVRAVCVPAGEHVVTWTYRPTIFVLGGIISLAAMVATGAASLTLYRKRADKGIARK